MLNWTPPPGTDIWTALRQAKQAQPGTTIPYDPIAGAFAEQKEPLRAFLSGERFGVLCLGRRGGKTDTAKKLLTAVTRRASTPIQAFYVSTTKLRAAATMWDELVLLNQDAKLGGIPNFATHCIRWPNGSKLWITGCENKKMANDLRGRQRVALYFVDEAQDWDDDLLRYFFDQVVYPSLADVKGAVMLAGTGGAPRGWWYERTLDDAWRRWSWLPHVNPNLPAGEVESLINKAQRDRGVDISDPSIQREFFAQFVADATRQIINITDANVYDTLPEGQYSYVIGGDVGTVDACAAVVWAWGKTSRTLYEVEHEELRGLPVSAQVAMFARVLEHTQRKGPVIAMVLDPGGGGAGLIRELQTRYGIPIIAAEKPDKAAACVMMRGDFRNGTIKIRRQSTKLRVALQTPEWEPDNVGSALKGHAPDLFDAAIYGYRHCYQYLSRDPPPILTTEERAQAELRQMLESRRREAEDVKRYQ